MKTSGVAETNTGGEREQVEQAQLEYEARQESAHVILSEITGTELSRDIRVEFIPTVGSLGEVQFGLRLEPFDVPSDLGPVKYSPRTDPVITGDKAQKVFEDFGSKGGNLGGWLRRRHATDVLEGHSIVTEGKISGVDVESRLGLVVTKQTTELGAAYVAARRSGENRENWLSQNLETYRVYGSPQTLDQLNQRIDEIKSTVLGQLGEEK